jgi:hypothetical protein
MAIDQFTASDCFTTRSFVPPSFTSPAPSDNAGVPKLAKHTAPQSDSPPPRQFRSRHLKVTDHPQTHESVPVLRLSGKWLAEAGFKIGSNVQVTVSSGRLVIEPKAPECKSSSQVQEERRAALRQVADRPLGATAATYPSMEGLAMAHDASCGNAPTAEASKDGTATKLQANNAPARCATRKVRKIVQTQGAWPQRIGAAIEPAFGDVLFMEKSRLKVSAIRIAQHAQVSESRYRAFDRGHSQPNLSTFIAIAWALGQDPRDLFEKLLLQVGLRPGMRPVISPGIG